MIFIALFGIIAIVVIGLNFHDTSNLEKIEQHLKTNSCKDYKYSKGSYKALCEDRVLEVHNSFFVDLQENSKQFYYKDINSLEIKKNNIIINENNKLEFKLEEEVNDFYQKLQKKLKQ